MRKVTIKIRKFKKRKGKNGTGGQVGAKSLRWATPRRS